MKSLKARFNGNAKEVVEYTRVWGRFKAMDQYDVKDYIAFSRFIETETGDPHFGDNPTLADGDGGITVSKLLDAFINKALVWQAEKAKLQDEVDRLKTELEYRSHQNALQIEPRVEQLLNLCKNE